MKWWYMKRFVPPQVANSFEYVFAIDEDSDPSRINIPKFIEILRQHNISIAQPALSLDSGSINHEVTKQQTQYDALPLIISRFSFPISNVYSWAFSVRTSRLWAAGPILWSAVRSWRLAALRGVHACGILFQKISHRAGDWIYCGIIAAEPSCVTMISAL